MSIKTTNLQSANQIQELSDDELKAVVGGAVDLETQLEKLNPQTELGKALLKSLEALVKAETKLEDEI